MKGKSMITGATASNQSKKAFSKEKIDPSDFGISPITQFRISYLKALAKAWSDEKYEKQLVWREQDEDYSDPEKQFEHNVFSKDEHFNYKNPWNVIINIIYSKDGPIFREYRWSGLDVDKMIIYIPNAPRDSSQCAEALAQYYQMFPTLFGNKYNYPKPHRKTMLGDMGNIGVSGTEPLDFVDLGGTILSAIALSWRDIGFRKRLFKSHNITDILKEVDPHFGTTWNFDFKFAEDSKAKFKDGVWVDYHPNVIQFNFPHKPGTDNQIQPFALASYNATGKEYPLTCY